MAGKTPSVPSLISQVGQGKSVKALSLIGNDPSLAAVLSKAVTGREQPLYDNAGNRRIPMPDTNIFRNISQKSIDNTRDSETVMQLLPDIALAKQILIASVMSPKDMSSGEITISGPDGILPADTAAAVIAEIKRFFDQDYKIMPKLADILGNMLFDTGAHPIAVIPENSLDDVINNSGRVSTESLSAFLTPNGNFMPRGLLGPTDKEKKKLILKGRKNNTGIAFETMQLYSNNINMSVIDDNSSVSLEGFEKKLDSIDAHILEQLKPRLSRTESGRAALEAISSSKANFKPEDHQHFLTVTDNFNVLKVPLINERIRQQYVQERIDGISTEAFRLSEKELEKLKAASGEDIKEDAQKADKSKLSDMRLTQAVYRELNVSHQPLVSLKTQERLHRKSVGAPLILDLPTESVIPVHIPGVPSQHIGYYILIDGNGYPLNIELQEDYIRDMSSRLTGNTDNFPSAMLNKVDTMVTGETMSFRDKMRADYSVRAYADMIEKDLLERLRNGVFNNGVALGRNDELYRIMLARTLAKQSTQLLFIPIELMTYFAMNYNKNGTGRSLLDDMRILLSFRVMVMFANVMASIKNSIGRTDVKIKLDESDPDPYKTIEVTVHELIKSRQQYFPLGINAPTEVADWVQRAGMEFTFEGHPEIPDVNIDIGEKATNYTKPDNDLEEMLRKRSIMGAYLTPEMVDAGMSGVEFATSLVNSNLMFAKRVKKIQGDFMPQVAEHMKKIVLNHQGLLHNVHEIIMNNVGTIRIDERDINVTVSNDPASKSEEQLTLERKLIYRVAYDFIQGLEAKLPEPDNVTIENQANSIDSFIKVLDPMLDNIISTEFMTEEFVGNASSLVDPYKKMLRAYFMRKFFTENGILPDLLAITATDANGEPINDVFKEQLDYMQDGAKRIIATAKKAKDFIDKSNKVMEADLQVDSGVASTGDEGGSSSGGDEGGGEESGGDDFGFGGGDDFSASGDNSGEGEGSEEGSDESNTGESEEKPEEDTGTSEEKPKEGGEGSDTGII